MNSSIGVVVWGIRNGFKNNWLSTNVGPEILGTLTDEMRQICNATIDKFYSIHITSKHTVLSVYNPNTKDHVGRKAYVAISMIVPRGSVFTGNSRDCLDAMLNDYIQKQGNSIQSIVTISQLTSHLQDLTINASNQLEPRRSKLGVFKYDSIEEIDPVFKKPMINEFNKVYFVNKENASLVRIPTIENVNSFNEMFNLRLNGFNIDEYTASINNKPVTSENNFVKSGDILVLNDKRHKTFKKFTINDHKTISLKELFHIPPGPKSVKSSNNKLNKYNKLNKFLMIIAGCSMLLLLGIAVHDYLSSNSAPVTKSADDSQITKVDTATAQYDFEKLMIKTELDVDSIKVSIEGSTQMEKLKQDGKLYICKTKKFNNGDFVDLKIFEKNKAVFSFKLKPTYKNPPSHKVESGETLSTLAKRYKLAIDSILEWNKMKSANELQEGKLLQLSKPEVNNREIGNESGDKKKSLDDKVKKAKEQGTEPQKMVDDKRDNPTKQYNDFKRRVQEEKLAPEDEKIMNNVLKMLAGKIPPKDGTNKNAHKEWNEAYNKAKEKLEKF